MEDGMLRDVKLCIVGDASVGKSSLVLRFASNKFLAHSEATIGASFMGKTISVGEKNFKYQIWDTAGQERFRSIVPMYYRGAHAAIIVYDITVKTTFDSLNSWVKALYEHGSPYIIIAIAANKCDKNNERMVEKEIGKQYADSINAGFFEVSALTSKNVYELFESIAKKLSPEEPYNYYGSRSESFRVQENKCKGDKCCN